MDNAIRSEEPGPYHIEGKQHWPLCKIVSGGQSGVDRAALDAALTGRFPAGGWCPEGRKAEDGRIPERYPLKELSGADHRERNVVDSDGTLIIYFDRVSGGTELTLQFCMEYHKPYLLIDADAIALDMAQTKVFRFIAAERIATLNVAGPRASGEDRAYPYTFDLISSLLNDMRTTQGPL
jgi:hypothetical protein